MSVSDLHDSIEKVQLADMGSYQCAVQSEDHRTLSEEGSVQLEGESALVLLEHQKKKLFSLRDSRVFPNPTRQVCLISQWSRST